MAETLLATQIRNGKDEDGNSMIEGIDEMDDVSNDPISLRSNLGMWDDESGNLLFFVFLYIRNMSSPWLSSI